MPDATPPVNRYRRCLSRSNNNSAVLAIVYKLSTLQQWFPYGPLLAGHLTRYIRAFSFRVHHRGFWPKPPKVVWSLLLQADSEGPPLISQTVAHLLSLSAVCCARGTQWSVNRTSEFPRDNLRQRGLSGIETARPVTPAFGEQEYEDLVSFVTLG